MVLSRISTDAKLTKSRTIGTVWLGDEIKSDRDEAAVHCHLSVIWGSCRLSTHSSEPSFSRGWHLAAIIRHRPRALLTSTVVFSALASLHVRSSGCASVSTEGVPKLGK